VRDRLELARVGVDEEQLLLHAHGPLHHAV
jgi:hypothetical protein